MTNTVSIVGHLVISFFTNSVATTNRDTRQVTEKVYQREVVSYVTAGTTNFRAGIFVTNVFTNDCLITDFKRRWRKLWIEMPSTDGLPPQQTRGLDVFEATPPVPPGDFTVGGPWVPSFSVPTERSWTNSQPATNAILSARIQRYSNTQRHDIVGILWLRTNVRSNWWYRVQELIGGKWQTIDDNPRMSSSVCLALKDGPLDLGVPLRVYPSKGLVYPSSGLFRIWSSANEP